MRTLKGQNLVRKTDEVNYPDGAIQNKTDVVEGTPVSNEVYSDLITNIYKLLRRNGVLANENEDSENNGYQLVEALSKHFNELNDLMQLLTVSGNNITAAFDFDNMPNNYVFIGRVSEPLISQTYTLNSLGNDTVNIQVRQSVSSNGLVLVWLNGNNSVLIPLENDLSNNNINTSFGTPLSFNQGSLIYFLSKGVVFNNTPSSFDIENIIQVSESNINISVVDVVIHKSKLLAFTLDSVTNSYKLFAFNLNNLNSIEAEVSIPSYNVSDNNPYMYCSEQFIYFTNSSTEINNSASNLTLGSFVFDAASFTLTHSLTTTIDSNFQKTSNAFIGNNSELYTFVNSDVYRYSLSGATRAFVSSFDTINGFVFRLNGVTYYTNGNTAVKWNY